MNRLTTTCVLVLATALISCGRGKNPVTYKLDYDQLVILDAEDLAEQGLGHAYSDLLPKLQEYVAKPEPIEELIGNDEASYRVKFRDRVFDIDTPNMPDESDSWGLATYALFAIVNQQLADSSHRFYAINGGNDLGGMFLTPEQAEACRNTLPSKQDWPYIPTTEPPYFGQYHD